MWQRSSGTEGERLCRGRTSPSNTAGRDGNIDRLPELAADLVSRNVDLDHNPERYLWSTWQRKAATSTIPIVFVNVGDPVAAGLVASLGRPGGNLTGFSSIRAPRADAKAARPAFRAGSPRRSLFALLVNPTNQEDDNLVIPSVRAAARAKGDKALCPEGQHRRRDRRCSSPLSSHLRVDALVINGRCVFQQSDRTDRFAGSAQCLFLRWHQLPPHSPRPAV